MPLVVVDLKNQLFVLPRSSLYINLSVITIIASDESTLDSHWNSLIQSYFIVVYITHSVWRASYIAVRHYNLYSDESSLD